MTRKIALLSCVKMKQSVAAPAGELYTSPLFRLSRAYAQAHVDEYYILSSKHGLIAPDAVVEPYELSLNTMLKPARVAWALRVQDQIVSAFPQTAEVILLAGSRYGDGVESFLRARGYVVSLPLAGLGMGKRLAYLKAHVR